MHTSACAALLQPYLESGIRSQAGAYFDVGISNLQGIPQTFRLRLLWVGGSLPQSSFCGHFLGQSLAYLAPDSGQHLTRKGCNSLKRRDPTGKPDPGTSQWRKSWRACLRPCLGGWKDFRRETKLATAIRDFKDTVFTCLRNYEILRETLCLIIFTFLFLRIGAP